MGAQELTEQWGNYFKMLYTRSDNPQFDNEWKQRVEDRVSYVMSTFEANSFVTILSEDVHAAITDCSTGRAAGCDAIC
ncbi:hypothetical protein DPMN_194948 [Dreissena polymorpha]|uniref:Uncharacterized protein n=1 Tax=Dreissena polymorpha TaxID=45954 RepID=A0A9D4B7G3_DREPO|nr:hypothetical protein DPMN_194948 [Dreissena polymorpha]